MSARLSTLALAVLAAGTTLLTACGQPSPANNTAAASDGGTATNIRSEDEPVDCGPVDLEAGITHTLIADPSSGGLVGCTEAFNVLGEYLAIPAQQRSTDFEGTALANDWTCGTDDGVTASIGCVKGTRDANDNFDFAFHTEDANTAPGNEEPGNVEPVDCGQVEPDEGTVHTLIADPATAGVVGCTEAFNVLDEYLAIPARQRSADYEGTALDNDWACGTDDGETTSIGCVKGTRDANGDYELAFHTEPVSG
jgi:hypothetical protein